MQSKAPFLKELERIRREMNRLFEETLLPGGYETGAAPPGTWIPIVDVVEDDTAYHLYAELPGVEPEDLRIEVAERRVDLSGHRRPVAEGHNFVRMESSYGPFRWAFDLEDPVETDRFEESFERGVLRLVLRKQSPEQEARV